MRGWVPVPKQPPEAPNRLFDSPLGLPEVEGLDHRHRCLGERIESSLVRQTGRRPVIDDDAEYVAAVEIQRASSDPMSGWSA